ncbi:MAG: Do family serine endopeptidase [Alphaproteobacteria bacterium]|nr:Do family serine endopeptidase [Alphaproteobacteria bacterium]
MAATRILALFVLVLIAGLAARPSAAEPPGGDVPTLAPMLKKVTPAVVNIAVRGRVAMSDNPLWRDPFFRRFFELPDEPPEREFRAAGSGVIVDAKNGYVLTSNHVVRNAEEVNVTLRDGRSFKATLVGQDPGADIAVIRIPARRLTALPMGDSDRLQVGDYVIAVGNPFGLGQTVTSGIVSALGRTGLGIRGYENFIQTDAPINPGNSGGALVDLRGRLVGINTAIVGPAGGNIGIGFAVPVNMARNVMQQLVRYGEVRRGRLGVKVRDLTPEEAKAQGLESSWGAVVASILPDSPASRAGLRAEDVIIAVDGARVRSAADLRNKIGLRDPGEQVSVGFMREGRKQTVALVLGQQ